MFENDIASFLLSYYIKEYYKPNKPFVTLYRNQISLLPLEGSNVKKNLIHNIIEPPHFTTSLNNLE